MKSTNRLPIDLVRRFTIDLGRAAGLSVPQSTTLAGFCLWFDLAGWPDFGLAGLPSWLEKLESRECDPGAVALITRPEASAAAVLDGRGVLAPLVLDQAAGIAAEKAREAGVGLIRLVNLGPIASASAVVANLASGPAAAIYLGPSGSLSIALPTLGAPPIVYESALAGKSPEPGLITGLGNLRSILLAEGDSLLIAVRDSILFPIDSIRERIESAGNLGSEIPGLLPPVSFEARRRQVFEDGLTLSKPTRNRLKIAADRLGVAIPWSKKA